MQNIKFQMKISQTKITLVFLILLSCTLSSCEKIENYLPSWIRTEFRVHYSECNRLNDIVYKNGSPFTGKVWAQDEESYLETQNGQQIVIIGLYQNESVAFKMEFYSPNKRYFCCYSTDGVLLFKQEITPGFRMRPKIWDFNGNELTYDNIKTDRSVQPIKKYLDDNVSPIIDRAKYAYDNQLNKSSSR